MPTPRVRHAKRPKAGPALLAFLQRGDLSLIRARNPWAELVLQPFAKRVQEIYAEAGEAAAVAFLEQHHCGCATYFSETFLGT